MIHHIKSLSLIAFLVTGVTSAQATVIQSLAGPFAASGGGAGATLIDTSNDTDNWMTNLIGSGGTIYLGFDWKVTNNANESGTGGFFGGLGIYNTASQERATIGNQWNSLNYSLNVTQPSSAVSNTSTSYTVGATERLVAKLTITVGGASNDILQLFLNQNTEGTPDASITFSLDSIGKLTNRAGNTTGAATLSDLVISSDYASAAGVIPEPAPLALISLGGLLIIRRRRD